MTQKRKSPDRPVCFFGRVIFEFFNNDEEDFKQKALKSLCKEARKQWNLSCLPVEDQEVENPERGVISISIVAPNHEQGKKVLDEVFAFFDANAPARILEEEIQKGEI